MLTETQDRERYAICGLNIDECKHSGGIDSFYGLEGDALKKLVELGYADKEDCQNCSPSIGDFIEFMDTYKDMFAVDGYIVVKERSDCRISIEAIHSIDGVNCESAKDDFVDNFRFADEFGFRDELYAWWD